MATNFWAWNWTYMCPTGLVPWQSQHKYLAPCFQEICLELPALTVFAIASSYCFGYQTVLVKRNSTQKFLLSFRIFISLLFILLPIHKLTEMIIYRMQIWPIDVLLTGVQIVTWAIHIGIKLLIQFNLVH